MPMHKNHPGGKMPKTMPKGAMPPKTMPKGIETAMAKGGLPKGMPKGMSVRETKGKKK